MSLTRLDIFNVRNITEANFSPSSTINFIYGANASGKSSLLEAIYLLGRLKSFRSSNVKKIIRFDSEQLIVFGQTRQDQGKTTSIGIQLDRNGIDSRIDKKPVKCRSEFAYQFPLQLIHPKSYQLLDAGPQLRREFMDWGIFNSQIGYLTYWRHFKKALFHRNALLKKNLIEQISVWDSELAKYGTIVADYRHSYIETFTPVFLKLCETFLPFDNFKIQSYTGWDRSSTYIDVLQRNLDKDIKYGYTCCGPHLGDFRLTINNRLAKDFVSRGQLKLLVLALKLAQIKILHINHNKIGCILIDDLSSELDRANQTKLLKFLSELNMQVFITATEKTDFGDISNLTDFKMFHVEQGIVKQL